MPTKLLIQTDDQGTIDAFQKMAVAADNAAKSTDELGKSGRELDKLKHQYHEVAEEAKRLRDQQQNVGSGLKLTELASGIQVARDLVEWVGAGAQKIRELADAGNTGLRPLADSFSNVGSASNNLFASLFATRGEMGLLGRATKATTDFLAEQADRLANTTKEMRDLKQNAELLKMVQQDISKSRELQAVSQMTNLSQIREEKKRIEELLSTYGSEIDTQEERAEAEQRYRAVVQAEETAITKLNQAAIERRQENYRKYYAELEERAKVRRESYKRDLEWQKQQRQKAADEEAALAQQITDARQRFDADTRNAILKEIELRAELKGDMKTAHELRMQQIRNETQAAIDGAKTELDRRRAAIDGERRLREAASAEKLRQINAEHQAEQERLQREMVAREAAQQKFKEQVAERRAMLEQQQLPQQIINQFSQQQVFDEIVRKRQEEAKRQFVEENRQRIMEATGREGNAGEMERRQMMAQIQREVAQLQQQIRRQAFREGNRGEINQGEIKQAQAQLLNGFAENANKRGQLDETMTRAYQDVAQKLVEDGQEIMMLKAHINAIKSSLNSERTRAQRFRLRG